MNKKLVQIGDRVQFSKGFLQSTSAYTGWKPFAKGTFSHWAEGCEGHLAVVTWDPDSWRFVKNEAGPAESTVNVHNLSKVRQ